MEISIQLQSPFPKMNSILSNISQISIQLVETLLKNFHDHATQRVGFVKWNKSKKKKKEKYFIHKFYQKRNEQTFACLENLIIRDRVERIWRFRRIRRDIMYEWKDRFACLNWVSLPSSQCGQLSRYVYGNLIGCWCNLRSYGFLSPWGNW